MNNLVFDIGANKGDTVNDFFKEGYKKVVAVEPIPQFADLLNSRFRDKNFVLVPKALSSYEGEIDFYLNVQESTLCTVSKEWINESRFTPNYDWHKEPIKVECTTLDRLIDEFGEPNLIKIDVENHEHEVLKGLTKNICSEIKFEWHEEKYKNAQEACEILFGLGYNKFYCTAGTEGGVDNIVPESEKIPEKIKVLGGESWVQLDEEIKNILPSKTPTHPYWGMIFAKK